MGDKSRWTQSPVPGPRHTNNVLELVSKLVVHSSINDVVLHCTHCTTLHRTALDCTGRVIFFLARIRLGTILGRFSIIYFSGLGLRIRVCVRVRVYWMASRRHPVQYSPVQGRALHLICFIPSLVLSCRIKSALRRTSGMIPELYNSGIPELPSS